MSHTAAICVSHAPFMGYIDPPQDVRDRVDQALDHARQFVQAFEPDLVVVFGPDHYNGVLYDMMPPFCVGTAANSFGDFDSPSGPLRVDRDAAYSIIRSVLAAGIDIAYSERMWVDHGFAQPLQMLLGGLDRVPLVPVFINGVAEPLGPPARARDLGAAIGAAVEDLDLRVLFLGSGGLSHDPPTPRLETATVEEAERIISEGRRLSPEKRAARQARSLQAGRDMARGISVSREPNPVWDRQVLDVLARGALDEIDSWTAEWCVEGGGHSAHEVRTWIAAHAALAARGAYEVTGSFYEVILEWMVGFGITWAVPTDDLRGSNPRMSRGTPADPPSSIHSSVTRT